MFAVRIFCMDHYMSAPIAGLDPQISKFRGSSVVKVPIIRIFGTTNEGEKACLHIHGAFPYIYIPYEGKEDPKGVANQLALALDKTLNIAQGHASSNHQHVYQVTVESVIPFYGYHVNPQTFLKIKFYNPWLAKRSCALLQKGAILGTPYQPHEAHIPFHQQFMIDHNLHGMNFIKLRNATHRDDSGVKRISVCKLEVDALAGDILNVLEIGDTNPGIAYICEEEKVRRGGEAEVSKFLTLERAMTREAAASSEKYKIALRAKLDSSNDLSAFTQSQESFLDATCDESGLLDVTCVNDEDASFLLSMINDNKEEDDDCILSQIPRSDEGSDEPELQAPLASVTTPVKDVIGEEMAEDALDSMYNSFCITQNDETENETAEKIGQLDGANNSSESSEDDEIVPKKKRARKTSSQFPALNVTVQSPSRSKTNHSDCLSQSKIASSGNTTVKRKLGFEKLDSTLIEENISCRYSPAKRDRTSAPILSKVASQEIVKIDEDIAITEIVETLPKSTDVVKKTIESKLVDVESENSSDIFTPETLVAIVSQRRPANKYDREINYIPTAGPSRDARIVLSGSSSSSLPTPYQREPVQLSQIDNEDDAKRKSFHEMKSQPYGLSDCEIAVSQEDSLTSLCRNKVQHTLSVHNLTINERIKTDLVPASKKASDGLCVLIPKYNPPSSELIKSTTSEFGIPEVRNQEPFYSDPSDSSAASMEVGQAVLKVKSNTAADCPEFASDFDGFSKLRLRNCLQSSDGLVRVMTAKRPPSRRDVELWVKARAIKQGEGEVEKKAIRYEFEEGDRDAESDVSLDLSLSGSPLHLDDTTRPETAEANKAEVESIDTFKCTPSQSQSSSYKDTSLQKVLDESRLFQQSSSADASHMISGLQGDGFKFSLENYQNVKSNPVQQHLIVMSMEVHVPTRGSMLPDPDLDGIAAIFYAIDGDARDSGCLCDENEHELFASFLRLVREWDPDILIGYEIETASWGYLVERGFKLGLNYRAELGRVQIEPSKFRDSEDREERSDTLAIVGRVVLDLWRLLRHELALTSYTFESCVYHVLHERVAQFTHQDLTSWWTHKSAKMRTRTYDYYTFRVAAVLRLVDHFDLVGRTSELARLFGILFYEVFSRGSQFRVESMMLRMAKPNNYVPVSPSVPQRARMRAPEYLPLILEPESKFYKDPVIVLDFQSLYPSMIIAYNYCFSTCVGRVESLGTNSPFEFGATNLKVSRARIEKLLNRDQLHFSPCGVGFVKPEVRDGVLPKMLREILDTRLLVKDTMKHTKSNKTLQRVLHSRQLGLKLIANVTYGYTAANFSGRMPAVEIADSVVSKGRETLLRAIRLVENTPAWKAKVVYGDTDSLFVLTPGRSREEAFRIGAEIAKQVTNENPSPVRLKLEKVYQPCILQTKKRYVGYLYESPEQKTPDFDAKGIETVRRDGCPAVAKMLEKCLRMLFETRDVSFIKRYVQRQFHKLLSGRLSIQDLTFAKEYRGESQYKPGACVPALELAKTWRKTDKRREPRRGERVPYVIVNGPPGLPLIRLVRSPGDVLKDPSLRPNAVYYITKVIIPPLNRCFLLIGADIHNWFNEMPRRRVQYLPTSSPTKGKKATISQYFATASCAACTKQTRDGLCTECVAKPQYSATVLHEKLWEWEKHYYDTYKMCQSCCGRSNEIPCVSLDCPVLYRLVQTNRDLQQAVYVRDLINNQLPNDP